MDKYYIVRNDYIITETSDREEATARYEREVHKSGSNGLDIIRGEVLDLDISVVAKFPAKSSKLVSPSFNSAGTSDNGITLDYIVPYSRPASELDSKPGCNLELELDLDASPDSNPCPSMYLDHLLIDLEGYTKNRALESVLVGIIGHMKKQGSVYTLNDLCVGKSEDEITAIHNVLGRTTGDPRAIPPYVGITRRVGEGNITEFLFHTPDKFRRAGGMYLLKVLDKWYGSLPEAKRVPMRLVPLLKRLEAASVYCHFGLENPVNSTRSAANKIRTGLVDYVTDNYVIYTPAYDTPHIWIATARDADVIEKAPYLQT